MIQFLQLLNGGDLPELRTGNTLEAIVAARTGRLPDTQERSILEENYAFLRKIEHRLQIMFDLQTHLLPDERGRTAQAGDADGLRRHAAAAPRSRPFERDYRTQDRAEPQDSRPPAARRLRRRRRREPEVDLVLDPDPPRSSSRRCWAGTASATCERPIAT